MRLQGGAQKAMDWQIQAVLLGLHILWGSNSSSRHTGRGGQGLQEPCFSIVSVKPTNNLFRPNKYFRQYPFCIHYFPSSNEKRTECQKVMEKLYLILEYIEIEEVYDDVKTKSKTMGTKMNAEIDNGVLHFFVNYDMYVNKLEEKTPMDSYDYNTDVRKGWFCYGKR